MNIDAVDVRFLILVTMHVLNLGVPGYHLAT